jgi:hypothetical protein
MNEETEKPGPAAPAAKTGCIRLLETRDVPRIKELWGRVYAYEADVTPEKNPVSIVLQNEADQTEMALVGGYLVTAVVHLVADPGRCRSIASDENVKLLVGQLRKDLLADPSVGAVAVLVPRSLRGLEEPLNELGLTCYEDLKVFGAVFSRKFRERFGSIVSARSM